ncbi:Protein FAR1-RELATED SEQUENCE 5 [Linum grandiflorum]
MAFFDLNELATDLTGESPILIDDNDLTGESPILVDDNDLTGESSMLVDVYDNAGESTMLVEEGGASNPVPKESVQQQALVNHTEANDINPSNEDTWKDLRFPTAAEALTFYVQYGQYKGFDVKNQLAQRNVVPGKFYYLKYTCNRALYRENSEHDPKNAGKMDPKPRVNIVGELKIGCEAFITMRTDKINNLYSITKFQDKHNHLLQGDEGKQFLKANRNIPIIYKVIADLNDNCGIGVRSTYDTMRKAAGGTEHFGFTHTDLKNHIRTKRTMEMEGDQCAAIRAGLRTVFPDSFHGLCTFHILQNAPKNLGSLCTAKFRDSLRYIMYDIEIEEVFEHEWKKLTDPFLQAKSVKPLKWLESLHRVKEQWCCVWLRKHFCLGMKSSQLSEVANGNLRGYVKNNMSLARFFANFKRMIENKRTDEKQLNSNMIQRMVENRYHSNTLAAHAAEVYTPQIFNFFKHEYSQTGSYYMVQTGTQEEGVSKNFDVYKSNEDGTRLDERTMTVDEAEDTFKCSCQTFEYCGWICKHIIRAFDYMGLVYQNMKYKTLPDKYIVKRWTRDATMGFEYSFEIPTTSSMSALNTVRFQALSAMMLKVITKACQNDAFHEIVLESTRKLLVEADQISSTESETTASNGRGPFENVRGLKKRTDNFGKSNKRAKGGFEIAMEKKRQTRMKKMKEDKQLELTIATPQAQ